MNEITQTVGLHIGNITLRSAKFAVLAEEDNSGKRLRTQQESQVIRQDGGKLEVMQRLRVDGFSGEKHIWEAVCEHVGQFQVDANCAIPMQQIIEVHAPSYLYSFGRELVADLARRSLKLLVLPPAAFSRPSNPKPTS